MTDTTTAHTAGPWSFSPLSMEIEALADPENSKTYYAPIAVIDGDWSPEINRANAQLIAAAPDLLEALEDMVHLFDHPGIYGLITQGKRHGWTAENVVERIGASRRAKAAIAKAKGA